MKNRRVRSNSGETMVEIMVSIVIFLMMMAVMQGAISFSSNAQAKSVQIRKSNAEICQALETSPYSGGGKVKGAEGVATLFNVEVELGKKEVSDSEGKTTTFYMFGVPGGEGAGGGTP